MQLIWLTREHSDYATKIIGINPTVTLADIFQFVNAVLTPWFATVGAEPIQPLVLAQEVMDPAPHLLI
jgi:hypothetical protein